MGSGLCAYVLTMWVVTFFPYDKQPNQKKN